MSISKDIKNSLATIMKARFFGDGGDSILAGHHKLFWPNAERVGVSHWEACYFENSVSNACIVARTSRSPLEVILDPTIFVIEGRAGGRAQITGGGDVKAEDGSNLIR